MNISALHLKDTSEVRASFKKEIQQIRSLDHSPGDQNVLKDWVDISSGDTRIVAQIQDSWLRGATCVVMRESHKDGSNTITEMDASSGEATQVTQNKDGLCSGVTAKPLSGVDGWSSYSFIGTDAMPSSDAQTWYHIEDARLGK